MPRNYRPEPADFDDPRPAPPHHGHHPHPRPPHSRWEVDGPSWRDYLDAFEGDEQAAVQAERALDRGPDEQRVLARLLIAVYTKLTDLESSLRPEGRQPTNLDTRP